MIEPLPPPFGGPPPEERQLTKSPLVRVLAQARFASILKIDSKEGVAPFQELVRQDFPLLEQVTSHGVQLEVAANIPNFRPIASNVWRFSNADRSMTVSLTSDAVTLEAQLYPGREIFMSRWKKLLQSVQEIFAPNLALRIGVRYLNRIHGDGMDRLPDWIEPKMIGVALPEYRRYVSQAISEASLQIEEGNMLLRWGIIPKGATIDPGLVDAVETDSWLLDMDAFNSGQISFEANQLTAISEQLSERVYAFFRWMITEDGILHFEQAQ